MSDNDSYVKSVSDSACEAVRIGRRRAGTAFEYGPQWTKMAGWLRQTPMTPQTPNSIHVGMVGLGMIFEETYLPLFDRLARCPLYHPDFGIVAVDLSAVCSRTGSRAEGT